MQIQCVLLLNDVPIVSDKGTEGVRFETDSVTGNVTAVRITLSALSASFQYFDFSSDLISSYSLVDR
jgi:hypothetical protein